jgi:predicted adenylyl cyclase CyaB
MIEVEIRGKLDEGEYEKLQEFLRQNGKHIESHDREMYLLYDYPGYDPDPLKREVDIRLRNTDGRCEIMLKQKASEHNFGRKEISLKIADTNLEKAKEIVKAFGCKKALLIHRIKEIYEYRGIEWSLVKTAPRNFPYFEAEQEVADEGEVGKAHENLLREAQALGLQVLTPEETRDFIYFLDREVNKEVEL